MNTQMRQAVRFLRLGMLATFAMAVVLSLGGEARAAFSVTAEVSNGGRKGSTISLTSLASGSTFTVGIGASTSTIPVGSSGGYSFTDAAGSTLYLLNPFRTASTVAIPNE